MNFREIKPGQKKDSSGKYSLVDNQGVEIIPPSYDDIWQIYPNQKIVEVGREGKYGLVDTLGREILPAIYEEIGNISQGTAKIRLNKDGATPSVEGLTGISI